jgi:predicted nucleic acid-binding protein
MKYVIDCSAMVKVVLPEADSPKAIRLLDEYRRGIHDLRSPDILPLEMMNALTTAERKKRITGSLAHWNYLMANCPDLEPHIISRFSSERPRLGSASTTACISRSPNRKRASA